MGTEWKNTNLGGVTNYSVIVLSENHTPWRVGRHCWSQGQHIPAHSLRNHKVHIFITLGHMIYVSVEAAHCLLYQLHQFFCGNDTIKIQVLEEFKKRKENREIKRVTLPSFSYLPRAIHVLGCYGLFL